MSTVQSGKTESKEETAPIEPKRQAGTIEPRKRPETSETRRRPEAFKARGGPEIIETKRRPVTIENRIQAGIIEPRGIPETIDTRRRPEAFETRGRPETIEPRIQAGIIEPRIQAGIIEPRIQAGIIEPRGIPETIETRERHETIETRLRIKTIETSGRSETIEARGQSGTIEARRQSETIEARRGPETIETRIRIKAIETGGRPETIEPRIQAGTIEPRGISETIETRRRHETIETRIKAIETRGRPETTEARRQSDSIETRIQAGIIETRRRPGTMESRTQVGITASRIEAETIEPRRQTGNIEVVGQAGIIKHKRQSRNTKWTEQASTSRSTDKVGIRKLKGHTGRTKSFSEQSNSSQKSGVTNLKLSNFVDIQQLLNIGYRNPELLPLIKRISVVGEIMRNFNSQVQSELVAMIKIVEKTVKEFVYMKNTAYNSEAVQETVYRLLPTLSKSFSHIVLKQGHFILDPALRNLVEWKKISSKLSKKKIMKKPSINLFDLSKRFQMNDLMKIGYDHPEFRTNIKAIFGVNAAMKHLNHEGQVEMYKIFRRIEKIIKDLVQEKTNPDGCHDIFLTPETLSSSLDYCIEKILKCLKSASGIAMECLQCEKDSSYVRNIHIKPVLGTLKRSRAEEPVNRQPKQQTIFECANWGVSSDCINNLESLIHHIAAKKGASEHAWLFETCVDWSEIASMFADYRSKTRQDMAAMQTLKLQILRELEQVEMVVADAKDFCKRMKNVAFTKNETLSDAIALSGQIEMLASEVDDYLTMLCLLIKELSSSKKEYTILSTTIRANRLLFMTKTQWKAFDFPFY